MWSLFKADVIDFIPYHDLEMLSACLKGDVSGISAAVSASAQACAGQPVRQHRSQLKLACEPVCAFREDVDEEVGYKVLYILVETLIILIIT